MAKAECPFFNADGCTMPNRTKEFLDGLNGASTVFKREILGFLEIISQIPHGVVSDFLDIKVRKLVLDNEHILEPVCGYRNLRNPAKGQKHCNCRLVWTVAQEQLNQNLG